MRFLGMCVYHHQHIKGYGPMARTLYDLTGNDAEWIWGEEQEYAFQRSEARDGQGRNS